MLCEDKQDLLSRFQKNKLNHRKIKLLLEVKLPQLRYSVLYQLEKVHSICTLSCKPEGSMSAQKAKQN